MNNGPDLRGNSKPRRDDTCILSTDYRSVSTDACHRQKEQTKKRNTSTMVKQIFVTILHRVLQVWNLLWSVDGKSDSDAPLLTNTKHSHSTSPLHGCNYHDSTREEVGTGYKNGWTGDKYTSYTGCFFGCASFLITLLMRRWGAKGT